MMPWSEFHFLRPWWLLLLPLGLLLFLLPSFWSFKKNPWSKVIAPHLLPYLMRDKDPESRSLMSTILWSFFLILLILALAGPTLLKIPTDVSFNKAPIIVCLEVSPHMLSKDILPSRLKRAIFKLEDLLKKYPGAEVSLIAFAGDAHQVVPLSDDYNTVMSLAKVLSPELMPRKGVNVTNAIAKAMDLIKRNPQAKILLITSTNVDENSKALAMELKASGIPVMLWAFATDLGAPMESVDGQFDKNRHGDITVSRLNRDFIKDLSSAQNVMPIMFTADMSDVLQVVRHMDSADEVLSKKDRVYDSWYDLGPYCLAFAMGLFLISYFLRREAWFICLLFLLPWHDAKASVSDWFLRKDQQAERALKEGNPKNAAELYSDDMRKGSAYYRAKMYDEAISHLKKVNTSDGHYNLGNAYAQKGQIEDAILSYDQALKLNPQNDDARANKEILEKLKQKEDQKNSSPSDDKKEEQKDEKEKSQSEKSKEEEEQQKKQQQNESSKGDNQKNEQKDASQKEREVKKDQQENKPENKPTSPEEKNMANKSQEKKQNEPNKMPNNAGNGSLDQESRYFFDQIEPNNSRYLERKFRKDSAGQKEAK